MVGTVEARWRVKYLGREIEDCVLLTDVWVYDEDRWQVVRRHSSPAPPNGKRLEGGVTWRRLRGKTASGRVKELTLRGIILGALITVLFTAANVYLGLKLGITFATSIPAAVISMAVLKFFRDSTIQENNIVQTIASAAGTLSAIIFVLPGPDHGRLVDRLSLLAVGRGDRHRRHPRRDVFGAAAARARDRVRPALSGRRRRRRSAQGRRRRRRRRGKPPRPQDDHLELDRLGRLRDPRPDQDRRRRSRAQLRLRRRRDDRLDQPVDGADRRRPPRRHGGRHRDAGRPDHQLVRARALADRRSPVSAPARRHRDAGRHDVPREGALHRRRHHGRRGDLDTAPDHGPDHTGITSAHRRQPRPPRRRPGQPRADRARHSDRHHRRRHRRSR